MDEDTLEGQLESVVRRFGGVLPGYMKVVVYENVHDWSDGLVKDGASEEEFIEVADALKLFSAELIERGVKLLGVKFDRESYDLFRDGRMDSRDLRMEWASLHADEPLFLTLVPDGDFFKWISLKQN